MTKEKKGFTERLGIVAGATKNIGTIVMWLSLILFAIVGIPSIILVAQLTAHLEDFLSDVKTDKSINMIGTLIDEDGARVLADAFKDVAYEKGCDSDFIEFTIDYEGMDRSAQSENSSSSESRKDVDTLDFNASEYLGSPVAKDTDSDRGYVNNKNVTTFFRLSFTRDAKGCYKQRGAAS